MKVLTATGQTQGWRDNDFCWAVEGELVLFVRSSAVPVPPMTSAVAAVRWQGWSASAQRRR